MPCSAVADYRRESATMPVPSVTSIPDHSEYSSRSKIGTVKSSSLVRRPTPATKSLYSSSTDIPRVPGTSSYRLPIVGRSTSLTDDSRDRSLTREFTRSRDTSSASTVSSRYTTSSSRLTSFSLSDSSKGFRKSTTNYTPSDLDDFRSTYGPSNYTFGSLSASLNRQTGKYGGLSSTTSTTTSSASASSVDIPRVKLILSKEKRPEASGDVNNLEVIRDENDNVTTSKVEETVKRFTISTEDGKEISSSSNSGESSTEVKPNDGTTSSGVSESSSSESSDSYKSYSRPTAIGRRDSLTNNSNGLAGLRNIGNTCFLNSVVQCLSNTRALKEYLINRDYLPEITNTDSRGALIKSFADVIAELWSDEGRIVNPSFFKNQIQKYAPRFMGYNQQDAQEFLRYLLQGLHDDINRVTSKPKNCSPIDDNLPDSSKASESWKQYLKYDNSHIVDLFVGQLKSTLKCTSCGHCSTTFEAFWDLSLPLPTRSGTLRLSQCLDHFTKEEILDGDEMPTCSKCKTRRKCTKSFSIQKFPRILVLHLKRFSPSERYRKLSATVEFPLTNLDMSPYSSTPQTCMYNLYAVSNHSGTAYSGHYTAYCMHPHSGSWHEYNDSRVSPVGARNVVSSEAYILFYEQISGVTTSRL